jgi:hypothetical protein
MKTFVFPGGKLTTMEHKGSHKERFKVGVTF